MTASPRVGRLVVVATQLVPLALVVVAEATWISVFAGLFQEFTLHDPVIGLPIFAGFVIAGIVLARVLGPRLGPRWPGTAFGIVLGAGLVGLLLSAEARTAVGSGGGPMIAAHPGGLLAGLAVLRGFAHARLPLAEDTVGRLLGIGVPALAIASTLGGLIAEPYRSNFLSDAFGAAILFVTAAGLALAFARLDAIGLDAGFDWRRNPPWLLLTVVILVGAIGIAIPLATVAGTVISIIVSASLVPLLIVGVATGFDRVARRRSLVFALAVLLVFILIRLFGRVGEPMEPAGVTVGGQVQPSPASQALTIGLGGFVLLVSVVATLVLIALWMRRTPPPDGAIGETRTIDPGGDDSRPRFRFRGVHRRPAPTNAVEAYVSLMVDLDRRPTVRRDPAETPAVHAARLRADGTTDLSLDLLAADYALARYGGVDLTAREDRRAVGRWRILRRRLAARDAPPRPRPGEAPTPDADLPLDLEPRRTF